MKLSHFRIQNYKVIDDTDWIPVDPSVTALVGKNESGKSGILRAIWKTNNVAGGRFDKLVDYPRDRYSTDRKGTQDVVSLKFLLNDAEVDELAAQFTALVDVRPTIVTRTTKYDGAEKTASFVNFDDEVEDACHVCGQRIADTVAAPPEPR